MFSWDMLESIIVILILFFFALPLWFIWFKTFLNGYLPWRGMFPARDYVNANSLYTADLFWFSSRFTQYAANKNHNIFPGIYYYGR